MSMSPTGLARLKARMDQLPSTRAGLCWVIRNEAGDAPADIFVFDYIGFDTVAEDFVKDVMAIEASQINLHINSYGGLVDDALAMYNALRQHPAHVTALIESLAASAASVVAMGADEIKIAQTAKLMIHDAWMVAAGPASLFHALGDFLDGESMALAGLYADKAGGEPTDWREQMLANDGFGTVYRGQDAIEAGLADALIEHPPRQENLAPLRAAAIAHAEELRGDAPAAEDTSETESPPPTADPTVGTGERARLLQAAEVRNRAALIDLALSDKED